MNTTEQIRTALQESFAPQHLEIIDESEQHRGHSGFAEGGESHFRVIIRAPQFAPMSRLQRHRAVHAALGAGLIGRIHALAIDVQS